jgi:N-sulfoglucosamine sulfohydrolase
MRLSIVVGWIIWLSISVTAASAEPVRRLNVVMIVADDLGLQLGCYGERTIQTPHIDRLAAESVRFTNAFCTTASCSPSRSVILTGMYSHANGQYGLEHATHHFRSHENIKSLSVLLAEAGYRTCSIGKVHVGPKEVYAFGAYANERIQGGRNPVRMAENARRFIEADPARPFFIYFCPTDPHRSGPGQFANGRSGQNPHPGVTPVVYDPSKIALPAWLPDVPEARREWAEYFQSISRFDQGVGAMIETLRATKHWEDTLVLVLSDNGPPFPGAKTTLYEPGVRLPLIVRDPKRNGQGDTLGAMASWVDLAPTVLDYAGVASVKSIQGRSLKADISEATGNPASATDRQVYFSHTFHEVTMYYPMRGVRDERYKYILNLAHPLPFPFASDLFGSLTWQGVLARGDELYGRRPVRQYVERPRQELYDLAHDPHEVKNLAADPAFADRLKRMHESLVAWQKRTADPWIIKYQHE